MKNVISFIVAAFTSLSLLGEGQQSIVINKASSASMVLCEAPARGRMVLELDENKIAFGITPNRKQIVPLSAGWIRRATTGEYDSLWAFTSNDGTVSKTNVTVVITDNASLVPATNKVSFMVFPRKGAAPVPCEVMVRHPFGTK